MEMKIQITEDYIGKRIDAVISELSENISRSQVQKLIKSGDIIIDGLPIINSSRKITEVCEVSIMSEVTSGDDDYEILAEDIPLEVLFEDEYVIVINKPAGMVCHPAPGHRSGTLVNAIMYKFNNSLSDIGGKLRPGIVHRLDKDTSGVMLVAKTNESHNAFAELFAREKGRLIQRKYTCFVFGVPFEKQGKIETFITRHPKNRQIYTTSETSGKLAITLYDVEGSVYFTSTKSISKINCELLTGRTHQIRVHMKHMGHHIVGDPVYGKAKIENTYPEGVQKFNRQALHSRELSFCHPFTKEQLSFEAQLPDDLIILDNLL